MKLILVNENDEVVGKEEKLKAHQEAKLHRAFSLLIFNSKNQLLLQKRSSKKYHCPNLWANSVCSHPTPQESLETAVKRRLKQEMGMEISNIKKIGILRYKKEFENGLTENEIDYVFTAKSDEKPKPNPDEVSKTKYLTIKQVKKEIKNNPEIYAYWFKKIIKKFF